MAFYGVMLHVHGIEFQRVFAHSNMKNTEGCYTTRLIWAESTLGLKERAIEDLFKEWSSTILANHLDKYIMAKLTIDLEEIREISIFKGLYNKIPAFPFGPSPPWRFPTKGSTFYSEE